LNLFVLLAVVFLPFPTRLLAEWFGEREAERVAVTLFGATLLVIRLAGVALDGYARREHLYGVQEDEGDEGELQDSRRKSLIVIIGYPVALLVGLVLPGVAVAFYLALVLFLVVPFREVALLFHRPA